MTIKNKLFVILIIMICIGAGSLSSAKIFSEITGVWARGTNDYVKYVFEANRATSYFINRTADAINITFKYAIPNKSVKKPLVRSPLVKHISIKNSANSTFVSIPLKYPVKYNANLIKSPWKLTLELERFPDKVFKKNLGSGIEYSKIIRKVNRGYAEVNLLKVDPASVEVFPAIAEKPKKESSFIETFLRLFSFGGEEPEFNFTKKRVSDIAEKYDAPFAINGTFFASSGRPLGILMIDKDLIAAPIYDRTALAITSNGKGYIDNFLDNTYIVLPDEVKIDITTINKVRRENEVILYTPRFGSKTDTDNSGIELTIVGDRIVGIREVNSDIPENGTVVSFSGRFKDIVKKSLSNGRKAKISLTLMPLHNHEGTVPLHIIGGGPRLVKSSIIYVAKKEERFKKDVANSRAARTAVGIDKDGNLLFAVVEGRPRYKTKDPYGLGMTLEELSELLIDYGAVDAMNLDGGGSSTLILEGELKNKPVNGSEVRVSNAILIRPK